MSHTSKHSYLVVGTVSGEGGAIVRTARKLVARITGRFISFLYCRKLCLMDEKKVEVMTAIQ